LFVNNNKIHLNKDKQRYYKMYHIENIFIVFSW